jgi:hypothetical protein
MMYRKYTRSGPRVWLRRVWYTRLAEVPERFTKVAISYQGVGLPKRCARREKV